MLCVRLAPQYKAEAKKLVRLVAMFRQEQLWPLVVPRRPEIADHRYGILEQQ